MSSLKSYFRTFPFQIENFSEVQQRFYNQISKVSYKDGTIFTVNPGDHENTIIFQVGLEVDHLEEDKKIKIFGRRVTFDVAMLDFASILNAIFDLIMELEKHEAEEWFKFNDKQVINPHE